MTLPAPPGSGSTEVLEGHDSPAAGSASFLPPEDQARAGDDVNHPMDVTSDSSPHAKSKDGSDGEPSLL